jgi:hypothetical protein
MKINFQGIKDNAQNAAGVIVGSTILKATGKRYGKNARGARWFSTVAANVAANGEPVTWFPFAVILK